MVRPTIEEIFDPLGISEEVMCDWLCAYLGYESVKQRLTLPLLRQTVLIDTLMKYSPSFRKELNEYRKNEIKQLHKESAIKLDCTLNEINKIFDKVYEDETEHKLSDPEIYIDWDAARICINGKNKRI